MAGGPHSALLYLIADSIAGRTPYKSLRVPTQLTATLPHRSLLRQPPIQIAAALPYRSLPRFLLKSITAMSVLPPKLLTLVFVLGRGRVLLGMKKRGFGEGNWNGFGGKKEPHETLRGCARRELMEETGLTAPEAAFRERGFLSFLMESDGMKDASGAVSKVLHVFVYSVAEEACTGEPTESEEMRPQWYPIGDVPYDQMWLDDKVCPLACPGRNQGIPVNPCTGSLETTTSQGNDPCAWTRPSISAASRAAHWTCGAAGPTCRRRRRQQGRERQPTGLARPGVLRMWRPCMAARGWGARSTASRRQTHTSMPS